MKTGQTIELNAGETATFSIVVKTRNPGGQNSAVDLSGKELWLYVKRNEQDADADSYIMKSIGNGITVTDAANGVAELDFYREDTESLLTENVTINFGWSLRLKYATVNRHIQEGILVVTPA